MLLVTTTTGCFGSFSLTRKVYNWNKTVSSDKWVRWLVFLVITIIPIYGGATLIDAIFTNSVEFWTGRNPMAYAPGSTKHVQGPNGEMATLTLREDNAIDVVVTAPGQPDQRFTLVRDSESVSAFDENGVLLGRVGDDTIGQPALLAGAFAR
jgi:hypothetical protein